MPKLSNDGPLSFYEGGGADLLDRRAPQLGTLALLGGNIVAAPKPLLDVDKTLNVWTSLRQADVSAALAKKALNVALHAQTVESTGATEPLTHDTTARTPSYTRVETPGPKARNLELRKNDGFREFIDEMYAKSDAKAFAILHKIFDLVAEETDRKEANEAAALDTVGRLTTRRDGMLDQTPAMEEWYAYAEPLAGDINRSL